MICWYVRMNLSTDTKEYNSFYTDEANWSHAAFIITKNHIIYFLGVVRPNSVTEKILPSRYRRMLLAPTVTRGSGAARSTTRRIPRTWSTRYNPVLTHMTRFESEKKTRSNGSPACHSLVSRSGDVLPLSLDSLHLKKRCTPMEIVHWYRGGSDFCRHGRCVQNDFRSRLRRRIVVIRCATDMQDTLPFTSFSPTSSKATGIAEKDRPYNFPNRTTSISLSSKVYSASIGTSQSNMTSR